MEAAVTEESKGHRESSMLIAWLLDAIDLMESGIQLMRQNVVRRWPNASPGQVDAELERWLFEQPVDFDGGEAINKEQP